MEGIRSFFCLKPKEKAEAKMVLEKLLFCPTE